jgi:hypothetical protein
MGENAPNCPEQMGKDAFGNLPGKLFEKIAV